MGFGLLLTPTGEYPLLKAADELQIGIVPSYRQTKPDPDEWIRRLGTLPLMSQPGERWFYSIVSDVLSVLIPRVCGQPLEAFLSERIFEPLGMKDTGFSVPSDRLDRLASCYFPNPATGALELFDGVHQSQWSRPPTFPSGANVLVSSLDDYLSFGQMLLSEGRHSAHAASLPDQPLSRFRDSGLPVHRRLSHGFVDSDVPHLRARSAHFADLARF